MYWSGHLMLMIFLPVPQSEAHGKKITCERHTASSAGLGEELKIRPLSSPILSLSTAVSCPSSGWSSQLFGALQVQCRALCPSVLGFYYLQRTGDGVPSHIVSITLPHLHPTASLHMSQNRSPSTAGVSPGPTTALGGCWDLHRETLNKRWHHIAPKKSGGWC